MHMSLTVYTDEEGGFGTYLHTVRDVLYFVYGKSVKDENKGYFRTAS